MEQFLAQITLNSNDDHVDSGARAGPCGLSTQSPFSYPSAGDPCNYMYSGEKSWKHYYDKMNGKWKQRMTKNYKGFKQLETTDSYIIQDTMRSMLEFIEEEELTAQKETIIERTITKFFTTNKHVKFLPPSREYDYECFKNYNFPLIIHLINTNIEIFPCFWYIQDHIMEHNKIPGLTTKAYYNKKLIPIYQKQVTQNFITDAYLKHNDVIAYVDDFSVFRSEFLTKETEQYNTTNLWGQFIGWDRIFDARPVLRGEELQRLQVPGQCQNPQHNFWSGHTCFYDKYTKCKYFLINRMQQYQRKNGELPFHTVFSRPEYQALYFVTNYFKYTIPLIEELQMFRQGWCTFYPYTKILLEDLNYSTKLVMRSTRYQKIRQFGHTLKRVHKVRSLSSLCFRKIVKSTNSEDLYLLPFYMQITRNQYIQYAKRRMTEDRQDILFQLASIKSEPIKSIYEANDGEVQHLFEIGGIGEFNDTTNFTLLGHMLNQVSSFNRQIYITEATYLYDRFYKTYMLGKPLFTPLDLYIFEISLYRFFNARHQIFKRNYYPIHTNVDSMNNCELTILQYTNNDLGNIVPVIRVRDEFHQRTTKEYRQMIKDLVIPQEPQMFKTLTTNLKQTLTLPATLTSTLNSIANTATSVDGLLSSFTKTITEFFGADNVSMLIVKLISFIWLISQEANHNVSNILALITLLLPQGVAYVTKLIAEQLMRAVKAAAEYFAKKEDIFMPTTQLQGYEFDKETQIETPVYHKIRPEIKKKLFTRPDQTPPPKQEEIKIINNGDPGHDPRVFEQQKQEVIQREIQRQRLLVKYGIESVPEKRNIKPMIKRFDQQEAQGPSKLIAHESIMYSMFDLCKHTIAGLFGNISEAEVKAMRLPAERLTMACKTLAAVKTLSGYLLKAFKLAYEFVVWAIFKLRGEVSPAAKVDLAKILDMYSTFKGTSMDSRTICETVTANFVQELHRRIREFQALLLTKENIFKKMTIWPYLNLMYHEVNQAVETIPPNLRTGEVPGRARPYFLYIWGDPGCGKSTFIQDYIMHRICMSTGVIKDYTNPKNLSFIRDPSVEHWDGYGGQPIVIYNDIFQNFMNEELVHKTINELTHINDDILISLNMARLVLKGASYFVSPIVIANAQSDLVGAKWMNDKCLSGGKHILRRRHTVVRIVLNEQYQSRNGSGLDTEYLARQIKARPQDTIGDPSNPVCMKDQYILQFSDPMTGAIIQTCDLEQGILRIETEARKAICMGSVLQQKLEDCFKHEWATINRDKDMHTKPLQPISQTVPNYVQDFITGPNFIPKVPDSHNMLSRGQQREAYRQQHPRRGFIDRLITPDNYDEMQQQYFEDNITDMLYQEPQMHKRDHQENIPNSQRRTLTRGEVAKAMKSKEVRKMMEDVITTMATGEQSEYESLPDLKYSPSSGHMKVKCLHAESDEYHDYELQPGESMSELTLEQRKLICYEAHKRETLKATYFEKYLDEEPIMEVLQTETNVCFGHCKNMLMANLADYDLTEEQFDGYMQTFSRPHDKCMIDLIKDGTIKTIIKPTKAVRFVADQEQLEFQKMETMKKDCMADMAAYYGTLDTKYKALLTMGTILGIAVTTIGAIVGGREIYKRYTQRVADRVEQNAQTHEGTAHQQAKKILHQRKQQQKIQQVAHIPENIPSEDLTQFEIKTPLETVEQQAQAYTQNNFDTEMKVKQHMILLQIVKGDITGPTAITSTACVLDTGGSVYVLPRHYWHKYLQCKEAYSKLGEDVYFVLYRQPGVWQPIPMDRLLFYEPKEQRLSDVIFMRILGLPATAGLMNQFTSIKDRPVLTASYLYGIRGINHKSSTKYWTMSFIPVENTHLGLAEYILEDEDWAELGVPATKGRKYALPMCYRYEPSGEHTTVFGDCGMLLLHVDAKVQPKILGFHSAGGAGTGTACALFREDIKEAHDQLSKSYPIITSELDRSVFYTGATTTDDVGEILTGHGFAVIGKKQPEAHPETGKLISVNIPIAHKTGISTSIVYDVMNEDYGPPKTAPAILRPYKAKDGTWTQPLNVSLTKLQSVSVLVSQEKYDRIVDDLTTTMMSWKSESLYNNGIKTEHEFINGFGRVRGVDMTTSPGYPYVLFSTGEGKKPWFIQSVDKTTNESTYVMGKYVRERFEHMENEMSQGRIPEMYWMDCLKDETRPLEKRHKPRIFNIGPMEHTLLMRKYFGDFLSHFMETYLVGESAVGIDPNSHEWTMKIKFLQEVSRLYLNGDFKWFDSTLAYFINEVAYDMAKVFYDDHDNKSYNNMIRRSLLAAAFHTSHIIGVWVFIIYQGNPSGFWFTTLINVIANMFFVRLAYIDLVDKTLHEFWKNIRPWYLGDDNIAAVSETLRKIFNHKTFGEVMKRYGMHYTTASKEGELIDDLLPIEQCSFLKRSFTYEQKTGLYIAQLERDVIMEIPRWSQSDPMNMTDQMNRFNSTLHELANYGKQDFISVRRKFIEYCLLIQKLNIKINPRELFTYEYSQYIKYKDYYPNPSLLKPQMHQFVRKNRKCLRNCIYNTLCFIPGLNSLAPLFDDEQIPLYERRINRRNDQIVTQQPGAITLYHRLPRIEETNECEDQSLVEVDWDEEQRAQMMSGKPPGDGNLETLNTISAFVDSKEPIEEEFQRQVIITYPDYMPKVTFENFISRPYPLYELTWTAAQPRKTLITTLSFPFEIRSAGYLSYKLMNIAFWRPSFILTVRLNGTLMHYGRLRFDIRFQGSSLPPSYNSYEVGWGFPWYQMSANAQNELIIKVPFSSYKQFIRLGDTASDVMNEVFQLKIWVSSPLSVIGATAASVNFTIFGEIEQHHAIGYTHRLYPNGFKKLGMILVLVTPGLEEKDSESEAASSGPTITEGISADIEQISNAIKSVVTLGSAVKVAKGMLRAASMFGFSIPHVLQPNTLMQFRSIRWNQIEDTTTTVVMGPRQDMLLSKVLEFVNGKPGEYDILWIMQHPYCFYEGQITSAHAVGAQLCSFYVSPRGVGMYSDFVQPGFGATYAASHMGYFARFFRYWRGSIRFHIAFIASPFHSARIRIVYIPYVRTGFAYPNIPESANVPNITIDITQETEYSFTIPYMQHFEWARLPMRTYQSVITGQSDEQANGVLALMLLNPLTSGESPVTPIQFQFFSSAGADFQFADPTLQEIEHRGCYQMAQMFNKRKACELPSMSAECLRNLVYPVLGGCDRGHVSGSNHMSAMVMDVRSLMNMVCPIYSSGINTQGSTVGFTIRHTGIMSPTGTDFTRFSWLMQLLQIYRYYRGSLRVTAQTFEAGSTCTVSVSNTDLVNTSPMFETGFTTNQFYSLRNYEYSHFFNDMTTQQVDVTLPVFMRQNCNMTSYNGCVPFEASTGNLYLSVNNRHSDFVVNVGLGCGDDFTFGCLIAVPRCTAIPPARRRRDLDFEEMLPSPIVLPNRYLYVNEINAGKYQEAKQKQADQEAAAEQRKRLRIFTRKNTHSVHYRRPGVAASDETDESTTTESTTTLATTTTETTQANERVKREEGFLDKLISSNRSRDGQVNYPASEHESERASTEDDQ